MRDFKADWSLFESQQVQRALQSLHGIKFIEQPESYEVSTVTEVNGQFVIRSSSNIFF